MTLERPRLKRRASAQHQHDISNDLLAEQNSMIGSGGVTQRLHVQDAESGHQPPHCNVETSRPLGLLEVSGGWGCLRAHFPYPASTIIQLALILCGDCMEICWPDRQSSQSITTAKGVMDTHIASSSIPQSKHRFQQLQLEDAISPWRLLSRAKGCRLDAYLFHDICR